MRLIFWLLALFAIAVGVVLALKHNSGSVLLVVQPYQIELSLSIFIILLIATFAVFYFAVRLLLNVINFNQHHRHNKAELNLLIGLKSYFEGNYVAAEKAASSALKLTDSSTSKAINAVVAARSAFKLGNFIQQDEYIAIAEKDAPEEEVLRLVTQAELLLREGRYEAALATLQNLYSSGGLQLTAVLQLEMEVQQKLGNWDEVLYLSGILERRQPFDKVRVDQLRHIAHLENIKINASDAQLLSRYWKRLSHAERMDSKLAVAATKAYMALGDCSSAHEIIERCVSIEWDSELISLYGECLDFHVSRQIQCAEVWLKAQPDNTVLLRTLGKLCLHCELWGKAQNYLEASLSVEPGYGTHLALAQLHEKLGNDESAMDQYNKGLRLTLK
jgi:HemY protein